MQREKTFLERVEGSARALEQCTVRNWVGLNRLISSWVLQLPSGRWSSQSWWGNLALAAWVWSPCRRCGARGQWVCIVLGDLIFAAGSARRGRSGVSSEAAKNNKSMAVIFNGENVGQ